jgi:hypothetical protein
MPRIVKQLWIEDDGVLSFEWTVLLSLVVIGAVAGLAGARDAIVDELGDAAQAMLALDHSYELDSPLEILVDIDGAAGPAPLEEVGTASGSAFLDAQTYGDCARAINVPISQSAQLDGNS